MRENIIALLINITVVLGLHAQHVHHSTQKESSHDEKLEQMSCPFLTKNENGDILLSWVSSKGGERIMCYATSKDKGLSFLDTVEIPASKGVAPHGENLPKLICKPNGEMIAVWGVTNPNPKNKHSGLMFYSQSFNMGKTWSKAKPIVKNPSSFDQRYFDVTPLPNGEAGIVWLDNPNNPDKDGSSIYFATTKGNAGFQNEIQIGETTCQCCRTDLLTDEKGNIHVAYRDILNDSIRDMVHSVSTDGGKTFSAPKRISDDNWIINGCPHTGPTMAANDSGLHFVWFTKGGEPGIYYTRSSNNGQTFIPRRKLSTSASHPQMATMGDGSLGIVWEEEHSTDDVTYSPIMLQVLKQNGEKVSYNVSETKAKASFPVITATDRSKVTIAWVEETSVSNEGDRALSQEDLPKVKQIRCKTIELK